MHLLTVAETVRSEATEVIKVVQQKNVRRRASNLSTYSQGESTRISPVDVLN
jgi:hypothetical protein